MSKGWNPYFQNFVSFILEVFFSNFSGKKCVLKFMRGTFALEILICVIFSWEILEFSLRGTEIQ